MSTLEGIHKKSWLALLLIIPLPTLSILYSLEISQGWSGNLVFILTKILMISIPLYWYFKLEERSFSWSPIKNKNDLFVGFGFGIGMSAVMGIAWLLFGSQIDQGALKELLEGNGLTNPIIYLGVTIYWICGNSLLEEFVFRWFIFEKFEAKVGSNYALYLSATAFTLHHTIAMLYMFPISLTILASFGIFIGGLLWSWLYLRYRSIWVVFLSHAIVDIMMFGIGATILLG
ncbi:MAG TPA: type II CAAX endopeptidase family protein [Candidatus Poseidoniaceae archaeon]|nr:type II CAAX endopeptidase family protein [Candidatus Poseidoniaceae archaeon]